MIKPGLYKHFKGKYYEVIRTAMHTETEETIVIYKDLDNNKLYARPIEMFQSNLDDYPEATQKERFKYVRDSYLYE